MILDNGDQAAVASETLDRIDREIGSANPSMEGCFIHVHDHLIVVRGRARVRSAAREIRTRERDQCVDLLRSPVVAVELGAG